MSAFTVLTMISRLWSCSFVSPAGFLPPILGYVHRCCYRGLFLVLFLFRHFIALHIYKLKLGNVVRWTSHTFLSYQGPFLSIFWVKGRVKSVQQASRTLRVNLANIMDCPATSRYARFPVRMRHLGLIGPGAQSISSVYPPTLPLSADPRLGLTTGLKGSSM